MSASENTPTLALSDIMHPMSPSPAPVDERQPFTVANSNGRSSRNDREHTPEELNDVEIPQFRRRLVEMGLVSPELMEGEMNAARFSNNLTEREKELVDMILRLTSNPRVDANQLEQQASAISRLTSQREYLIAQADEERRKWQSERESWDRTAEALLTQKTRPQRSEDLERQKAVHEAETKSLRDRLHDRQRRLSTLEQEIVRLKPLLLMQSYPASRVTQPPSTRAQTSKVTDKGRRRESGLASGQAHVRREDPDSAYGASSSKLGPFSHPPQNALPSSSASRPVSFEGAPVTQRRKGKEPTGKTKKSRHQRATPIFSDAYSEHILLASQKIGRKRSTIVTGLQKIAERERESLAQEQTLMESKQEQNRLEKDHRIRATTGVTYYRPVGENASPQRTGISRTGSSGAPPPLTPQRNGYAIYSPSVTNNPNPGGANAPSPSTYVFVNTSATPPSNTASNPGATLNTPSRLGASDNTTLNIRSAQPTGPHTSPTPLDSLVDAARMMGEHNDRTTLTGQRRSLDEPDSPTSKRRKVSTEKTHFSDHQGPKIDRVRSALDVLADQAAAAVSEPGQQSRTSSTLGVSAYSDAPGGSKGRGRVNSEVAEPAKSSKSRTSSRTIKPSAKKRGISLETASASTSTSSRTTTRSRGRKQPVITSSGSRVIARPSGPPLSKVDGVTYVALRPVVGWGDRPAAPRDNDEDAFHSDSPERPHEIPQNPPRDISSQSYVPAVQGFAPTNGYRAYSDEFDEAARRPITPLRTPEPPDQLYSPEVRSPSPEPTTATIEHLPPRSHSSTSLVKSMLNQESQLTSIASHSRQSRTKPSTEAEQDEDAEGEEEDDDSDADAEHVRDHPRTRSPPPPDPPPPGFDNGAGPGAEHGPDPDADAEGDMDTDQSEEPSSGMTDSANEQSRMLQSIERTLNDALTRAELQSTFRKDLTCRPPHQLDLATKSTQSSYRSNRSEDPFLVRRLRESPIFQSTASSDCAATAQCGRCWRSGYDRFPSDMPFIVIPKPSDTTHFGRCSAPYSPFVPCDSLLWVMT